MKNILGFDIGTTSIGWAYISVNDGNSDTNKIIDLGSRIIPLTTDESAEFTKGNAITKTRDRTLKRSARRNNQRYKLRRSVLKELCSTLGIMPEKELFELDSRSLYRLRDDALKKEISLKELARIWFHLNQKRGYKSSRKTNNEEESDSDYLNAISEREAIIKDSNLTIGQFFYKQLLENEQTAIKKNIFNRASYINEFDLIWNAQKVYHPQILTDDLLLKVRDQIVYYQRPLKSQKHLVSECQFEKHHKVSPKSSPYFQLFRIWQDINALRIQNKQNEVFLLTDENKVDLFNYLQNNDKAARTTILKMTGFPSNYFLNLKKEIKGNSTRISIKEVLEKQSIDPESYLVFDPLSDKPDTQPLYKLWHLIYSIEDSKDLINALMRNFSFDEETAKLFTAVSFVPDYGSVSVRAIRKMLPFLSEGKLYHEAAELAGYRHSNAITKEENKARELINIQELELIKKGELRNPVVEKIINQVINLTKSVYERFGAPDEIRIELARELKQNIKERKRTFDNNNNRNKDHNAIEKLLLENPAFKGKRVSRKDIERYKLWREFDGISPYEPNKMISLTELYSGAYDVDHVIPQARLFDDSFLNKVIARRKVNEEKSNMTAFDYMKAKSEDQFNQFLEIVNNNKNLYRAKRDKLLMSEEDIPDDFIDRQLRETQYITIKVKEILTKVCRNTYLTSGTITDYLKHNWGYDDLISYLNIDKYRSAGQTEFVSRNHVLPTGEIKEKNVEVISEWNKRDDHRHHALDALIVACTKQSYIQQLNTLNQFVQATADSSRHGELKKIDIRQEQPFSHAAVKEALKKVLISFKSGKKLATKSINVIKSGKNELRQEVLVPRGQLHKETIYGKIKRYKKVPFNIRFKNWDRIVDAVLFLHLTNHIKKHNNDLKKAFADWPKDPQNGNKIQHLTIWEDSFVINKPINTDFKADWVNDIIDKRVRSLVKNRLSEFDNKPKEAFKDLTNNPIIHPSGFPVNSVRLFSGLSSLEPLHKDEEGNPIDFVSTRNNHHVAIYLDEKENRHEEIVTFWEALERKKQGLPIIKKQHEEGWQFLISLQQNEMVVFDLNPNEIDFFDPENRIEISANLYRVQKLASKDYVFRHHLETRLIDTKESLEINRYKRIKSLDKLTCVKVKVNNVGCIVKVEV